MTDQEKNYYFKKIREDLYAYYKEWDEPISLEQINSDNIKARGLGLLTTDLNEIVKIFSTKPKNETEKATTPISLGTLKGFYGIDKNYKSFPNPHTLNIISIYLGYQDWSDYIMKNKANKTTIEQQTEMKEEEQTNQSQEKDYPKNYDEFEEFVENNGFAKIFRVIEKHYYNDKMNSSAKTSYNQIKKDVIADKTEYHVIANKERLLVLMMGKNLA